MIMFIAESKRHPAFVHELNAASRRTFFKLRKTLNDAKMLSLQLCSFAMQSYKTLFFVIVFF